MINQLSNFFQEYRNNNMNVCLSGGAVGTDHFFSNYSLENNHVVVNFIFNGHNSKCDPDTLLSIPDNILQSYEVYDKLKRANKTLQRKIPHKNTYVYKLLARNYFQIKDTDRVYAISKLISPSQIDGGTAWAVQMYLDSTENPELYLYDYITEERYKYSLELKEYVKVDSVPLPHGIWTGIGSRKAPEHAIRNFLKQ